MHQWLAVIDAEYACSLGFGLYMDTNSVLATLDIAKGVSGLKNSFKFLADAKKY